jgi:hypothetical protein
MRNCMAIIVCLAACSTPEQLPTPSNQALRLSDFTIFVDVVRGEAKFLQATGDFTNESVTIPYGTSGKAAYLHTRVAQWHVAAGSFPNFMSVGVSAENLYVNQITNYTAVIDSISDSSVGMCNITKTAGGAPPACQVGGMASTWSCASGASSTTSPGMPPCRLNYGTINHTGNAGPAGTTAGDPGVPLPWALVDVPANNFTVKGHIEGDAVPAS